VPTAAIPPRPIEEGRWKDVDQWWLAVEISGRTSRVYDRDHKGPAYLALGVREYWRADLREQCVYVSRLGGPEVLRSDELTWLPPGRAEPLAIVVDDLFR
jgi:Uma2 family endonuclease